MTNTLQIKNLRQILESAFTQETAAPATVPTEARSRGQCAACAVVVNLLEGGQFVSAIVNGESHWFNRLFVDGVESDVDLTGDQYGFESIQIKPAGQLYPNTRVRNESDLRTETVTRAHLLGRKAKLLP